MNTEQQLRDRAEAILIDNFKKEFGAEDWHLDEFFTTKEQNAVLSAMIDFHKQELQRIGEVYVVSNEQATGYALAKFYGFDENYKLETSLKKLSLLGMKDLEASDNKNVQINPQ